MPSATRMRGSNDSLCENQVDDEEQNDSSSHEDLCGNGDSDVGWPSCPNDTHDAGNDASHAEAEHHCRHDEFVTSSVV